MFENKDLSIYLYIQKIFNFNILSISIYSEKRYYFKTRYNCFNWLQIYFSKLVAMQKNTRFGEIINSIVFIVILVICFKNLISI